MTFWFGFYDHPYRTQWTVNTEEEMNDFQPEYVILYDNVEIWANQTGVTKRLDPNYERMEAIRNLFVQEIVFIICDGVFYRPFVHQFLWNVFSAGGFLVGISQADFHLKSK